LRQTAVICELAIARIGMPGRHLPCEDLLADGFGPGPRRLISQQRHWRGLARAMTFDATPVEDRRDIFVEIDSAHFLLTAPVGRRSHQEADSLKRYKGG